MATLVIDLLEPIQVHIEHGNFGAMNGAMFEGVGHETLDSQSVGESGQAVFGTAAFEVLIHGVEVGNQLVVLHHQLRPLVGLLVGELGQHCEVDGRRCHQQPDAARIRMARDDERADHDHRKSDVIRKK